MSAGAHREPRLVEPHAHKAHAVLRVDLGDLAVARILDGVALLAPEQLDDDVIEKLRARADDDLLRIHRHAAELVQVRRDGAAQLLRAVIGRRLEQARPLLEDRLAHEPRPDGERKVVRLGRAGCKVEKPRRARRQLRNFLRCGRGGAERPVHRADEIAAAFAAVDIPLGDELLIGVLHRDNRQLQMVGKRPLGRELLPRGEPPGENIGFDAVVELLV